MVTTMHRVLFDRSIFHRAKFVRLQASSVRDDVKARKYQVLFTPMFVEETLTHAFNNRTEFRNHWRFLMSLTGHRWFKSANDIVAIELGNKIVGREYYLQPKPIAKQIARNVDTFLRGDLLKHKPHLALADMERNKRAREQFRKRRLDLRTTTKPSDFNLDDYLEANVVSFISERLMTVHKNSERFLDTWSARRVQCKFTEHFIRALFATLLLPLMDHNLKVGINDKADAEQLAYLVWADVIVSDDSRFMNQAFKLMYSGAGKQFLTLEQFLSWAMQLRLTNAKPAPAER
jgi:hypothetical protein